jgi:hypothetical protein
VKCLPLKPPASNRGFFNHFHKQKFWQGVCVARKRKKPKKLDQFRSYIMIYPVCTLCTVCTMYTECAQCAHRALSSAKCNQKALFALNFKKYYIEVHIFAEICSVPLRRFWRAGARPRFLLDSMVKSQFVLNNVPSDLNRQLGDRTPSSLGPSHCRSNFALSFRRHLAATKRPPRLALCCFQLT